MSKRRDQNGRDVVGECCPDALEVVVRVANEVGAIFAGRTGLDGRAPRCGTVIRALRHEYLSFTRRGTCDCAAQCGGVGAVFLEHGPVGVGDYFDQSFGEFDHALRGSIETVAERGLTRRGFFDLRVLVTQEHRAPATHQVDELSPVHVNDAGATSAGEELWVLGRQGVHIEVAVHAAGDHGSGPRAKFRVPRSRSLVHVCRQSTGSYRHVRILLNHSLTRRRILLVDGPRPGPHHRCMH